MENTENSEEITFEQVHRVLRHVKDPDLNLNIVDLGLVYDVRINGNNVAVDLTLTTPACPSGDTIMQDANEQLKTLGGIGHVELNLVWSPPWGPHCINERVRTYLGF